MEDADALVGPDPDEMDGLAVSAEAAAREFGGADSPKLVPEVHPNIMTMLTQLTMQQKEILQKIDGVDKLGDTLSTHQLKMEEKMSTFQNKQQNILDSMDKKIAKNTKDNSTALQNLDTKMKENLRMVNERLDKIENKATTAPVTPLPARSRSSPMADTSRWSTPMASSGNRNSVPFEPKLVHIQGWGPFGSGIGLTQAEGKELGIKLKSMLPETIQMHIDDILCNYMVNSRVTFRVSGGRDTCWLVKRALDDYFKNTPTIVKNKNIYALVEAPPEIRNKNRIMAIAANTFEKLADHMDSLNIRRDFRAGTLYWAPDKNTDMNLIPLGRLLRATLEWRWLPEGLSKAIPDLDVAELEAATSEAITSQ